jgi:hypothetical protein
VGASRQMGQGGQRPPGLPQEKVTSDGLCAGQTRLFGRGHTTSCL